MKKFVLFVMLMMSVSSLWAQKRWSLTPEMGMTAIKRGGGAHPAEQRYNARWKVGVGVEYAVKPDVFSLKSGLYYTQRGYSFHSMSYGGYYSVSGQNDNTFGEMWYKTNRHFLQVPLMANFSIRLADDVRLNLAAGPISLIRWEIKAWLNIANIFRPAVRVLAMVIAMVQTTILM